MNISQNPYQISKASDPVLGQGNLADKFKTIEDEENKSKAPATLPDPIDKIVPILGNIYVSMMQARNLVQQTYNNASANTAKLDQIQSSIDNINKEIVDLSYQLSMISL